MLPVEARRSNRGVDDFLDVRRFMSFMVVVPTGLCNEACTRIGAQLVATLLELNAGRVAVCPSTFHPRGDCTHCSQYSSALSCLSLVMRTYVTSQLR